MGKQWNRVDNALCEMRECGVAPDAITYTSLITGCAERKLANRAQELLREMQDEGIEPDVYTYTALITACLKSGKWEAALQVLARTYIVYCLGF